LSVISEYPLRKVWISPDRVRLLCGRYTGEDILLATGNSFVPGRVCREYGELTRASTEAVAMNPGLPLADELAAVFARMSGLLLSGETVATALSLITSLAKEAFEDSGGAGVTLLDEDGARVSAAATDEVVEQADRLQYELGQGPCLTAWARGIVVRVDDVAEDERWPEWSAAASRSTSIRAVLSAPMIAGGESLGAMKVYSYGPNAYGPREESLLARFAAPAAVLVANVKSYQDARRVSDDLKNAIRGRDLINIAKGVIMAREGTDEETAFMVLAGMANEQHRPLGEVAAEVARSTLCPEG
jgi:GAF domain-containing protein